MRVPSLYTIAPVLAVLAGCWMNEPARVVVVAAPIGDWTTVTNDRVRVDVERVLYTKFGSSQFFMHVRITNPGAPIAVALRTRDEVFYPNQWGASSTEHRMVIDERIAILGPLDDAARAAILADFRAGELEPITSHTSVDYYEAFNASTSADANEQLKGYAFMIVAMSGQLKLCDGVVVTRVTPSDREVTLRAPITWKAIPNGARVITER